MRIVEPDSSSAKQLFSCGFNSYNLLMVGVNFENGIAASCQNLNTVYLFLVVSGCAVLLTNANVTA